MNRLWIAAFAFACLLADVVPRGARAATPELPSDYSHDSCVRIHNEAAERGKNTPGFAVLLPGPYDLYPCEALDVVYQWQPLQQQIQSATNAIPHAGSNLNDPQTTQALKSSLLILSGAAHRIANDYKRPPQEPRDLCGDYLNWSQKLFAERGWPIPKSLSGIFDDLQQRISKPYVDPAEQQAVLLIASERGNALANLTTETTTVAMYDQVGFAQARQRAALKNADAVELAAHDTYAAQVSRRAATFHGFGWLLLSAAALSAFGVFLSRRWLPWRGRMIAFAAGTGGLFVAQLAAGTIWTITGLPFWLCMVLLLALFGIVYVLFRDKLSALVPGTRMRGIHGSAAWATVTDALRLGRIQPAGNVLADSFGFALGRIPDAPATHDSRLRFMGHILTCAPTRSGKGIGAVIPTLLEYPGSAIVLDIKGENHAVTANARRAMGHEICLVDPFGATGAEARCFNPLDTLDLDSPDVVGQASALAELLVIVSGTQDDNASHFNDSAKDLLKGLLVHVAGLDDPARRTLGEVRRIVTLPLSLPAGDDRECLADHLADMTLDPQRSFGVPFRTANGFQSKETREASSVLSTVLRHTAFLDDPRIVAAWSRSDFTFRDLKRRPMTVYIVLPPDRLAANVRFMRCLVGAALSAITGTSTRPSYNVLFLLDEFAQLGRMQAIEDAISLVAGYGARFWLLVQDLSQLKGVYPKWQTFLANWAKQFFGVDDPDTAKYVSEMLGQETIQFRTIGDSSSTSMQGASSGTNVSQQFTGRSLLTPDEVMRQGRENPIVLIQGEAPYSVQRPNYLIDAEYAGLASPNPFHGNYGDCNLGHVNRSCPLGQAHDRRSCARKHSVR